MASVAGHGREPELGPLPLVLVPDLGGRDLVAAAGTFEDGLDRRSLVLQRAAGWQTELDLEVPYVRGISRSS